MNHETIEMACIALGALALLIQTIVLLAIYIGVRKSTAKMKSDIEEMRSSVMPIVNHTREAVVRLTPKIETGVNDFAEAARCMRAQAAEIEVAVNDALERVRKQTSRMDAMFSSALDTVDKASAFVADTVSKPVRQLSGLLAGLKAALESLRDSDPSPRRTNPNNDTDMFV